MHGVHWLSTTKNRVLDRAVALGGQIAAVRVTPGACRPGAAGLYASLEPVLIGHPRFGFERSPNRIKPAHCLLQRFDSLAECQRRQLAGPSLGTKSSY